MTGPPAHFVAVTVDSRDPESLAAFWCAVLGTSVVRRWADTHGTPYVEIGLDRTAVLVFQRVDTPEAGKNRLHLDIAPSEIEQSQEIERLVGLGARLVDDASGNHWVVLADPEDNEFCVLTPR